MKQLKGIIISIIAILSIVVAVYEVLVPEETSIKTNAYDQVLEFPKDRYPETGKHITDAIKKGIQKCVQSTVVALRIEEIIVSSIPIKKGMIVMNGQWRCVKKAEKSAHRIYKSSR